MPSDFEWTGVSRHIEITAVGQNVSISVDGEAAVSFSDPDYQGGTVGIRLWNEPSATFDNVRIMPITR